MPLNPYFLEGYDEEGHRVDGVVKIGFNAQNIRSHKWLRGCMTALKKLLRDFPDQRSVDSFNFQLEKERQEEEYRKSSRVEKTIKPKQGYVYILKSDNLFKIGRTRHPKSRLKTYRTENPHGIWEVIMQEVDDYKKVEVALLKKFSAKRKRGEWFNLNKKDIKEAKKIIDAAMVLPF